MRRMFLVPASWPLARGRPCLWAQRPLPSMMIPTCWGTFTAAGSLSDLHDLCFFSVADVIYLLDIRIRQLLQPLLGTLLVVGRKRFVLLEAFQVLDPVAPHIADRDSA